MPHNPTGPRSTAWAFLVLAAGAIAALTLPPGGAQDTTAAWSCIFCGDRGIADAILNVVLFAPFGAAVVLVGIRARRAIMVGAFLSAAIELVQIWIPGRDSSIGDVLSNTLGTAIGVALVVSAPYWLVPGTRPSRVLAVVWTAAAILAAWAPAVLLQVSLPHSTYYGQWGPDLDYLEWYRGQVLEAHVGTLSVPDGRFPDSEALRAALAEGAPITVRAKAGPPVPDLGPLFSIYDNRRREIVLIGPDRDDLVYRFRTRASTFGLDSPDLRARGLMRGIRPGDSLAVAVRHAGHATCISLNGREECGLAFGPGAGWSLLEYERHWPPWFMALLDTGWLIGLALPIGYWSRRGTTLAVLGTVFVAAVASAAVHAGASAGSSTLCAIVGLAVGAVARLMVARGPANARPA